MKTDLRTNELCITDKELGALGAVVHAIGEVCAGDTHATHQRVQFWVPSSPFSLPANSHAGRQRQKLKHLNACHTSQLISRESRLLHAAQPHPSYCRVWGSEPADESTLPFTEVNQQTENWSLLSVSQINLTHSVKVCFYKYGHQERESESTAEHS